MNSLPKLCAALFVAACAAALTALPARAARPAHDGADAKRAAKIIAKLRRLDEAAGDERAYRSVFKKLYPGLFAEAARLREGDVKTDLTTAVFLHESAYANRHAAPSSAPVGDCDAMLRDVYRGLCREQGGGPRGAAFLRGAARLHAKWAAALLDEGRGAIDPAATAALEEMRAARALDARLAARAVAALGTLSAEVNAHPSLYEFESRGGVARVGYEQFAADLSDALFEVDRVLAELPRGPLHRSLRNARNAFREGASWWGRGHRAQAKTVAASAPAARDTLKGAGLDAQAVSYTAVCDWRQAARALREAQAMIESFDAAPPRR